MADLLRYMNHRQKPLIYARYSRQLLRRGFLEEYLSALSNQPRRHFLNNEIRFNPEDGAWENLTTGQSGEDLLSFYAVCEGLTKEQAYNELIAVDNFIEKKDR